MAENYASNDVEKIREVNTENSEAFLDFESQTLSLNEVPHAEFSGEAIESHTYEAFESKTPI